MRLLQASRWRVEAGRERDACRAARVLFQLALPCAKLAGHVEHSPHSGTQLVCRYGMLDPVEKDKEGRAFAARTLFIIGGWAADRREGQICPSLECAGLPHAPSAISVDSVFGLLQALTTA